jgi:tRNA(adenine34) deaminase
VSVVTSMHDDSALLQHEIYMRAALAEAARAAAAGDVPVGAIVVCQGAVVARAFNRRESDADPVAHAELLALRQAARRLGKWRLVDCQLYVTLELCVRVRW